LLSRDSTTIIGNTITLSSLPSALIIMYPLGVSEVTSLLHGTCYLQLAHHSPRMICGLQVLCIGYSTGKWLVLTAGNTDY
jgi:hypothetical protein